MGYQLVVVGLLVSKILEGIGEMLLGYSDGHIGRRCIVDGVDCGAAVF